MVCMRRHVVSFTAFLMRVTPSTKSTNFGSRYLVEGLQNGTKFGRLTEGDLLYIRAKISEL